MKTMVKTAIAVIVGMYAYQFIAKKTSNNA